MEMRLRFEQYNSTWCILTYMPINDVFIVCRNEFMWQPLLGFAQFALIHAHFNWVITETDISLRFSPISLSAFFSIAV